jgi:hypothetical protein
MPGIERLPRWLRLVLYWILFTVGVAAIASLVRSEPLTLRGILATGVIVPAVEAIFTGGLVSRIGSAVRKHLHTVDF